MKIFIIRAENPLDHEESGVVAVFNDEALADEALSLLSEKEEQESRKTWNDRWRSFATYYYVQEQTVATSPLAVVQEHYKYK